MSIGRALSTLMATGGLLLVAWALPVFDWLAPEWIDRGNDSGGNAPCQVLLISLDGLAPWVLEQVQAPTLARLAREGSEASQAETIVPSRTLPAHASLLSGLPPEAHGVSWNRYEPWRRPSFPSVFSVCRERGLRCGLFAGKRKFVHFAEREPGVDRYAFAEAAADVLAHARRYLAERSPDFAMIHLAEIDRAGHEEGWGSPAQRAGIRELDAQLGAFLERAAGLTPRPLAVIVTADHGGWGTGHGGGRPEDVRIPWIAWGHGVPAGATLPDVGIADTAPSVLQLLGVPVPADWPAPVL